MSSKPGERRLYDSRRWRKAREQYLKGNPLCVDCLAFGKVTPASVVDHVIPHRGDERLFWDRANWAALCAPCHSAHKQREEKGGGTMGCDQDGVPMDRGHPWRA